MAIVPADELGRADDAGKVLAGDSELAVVGRAGGKDHRVIELESSATEMSRPTLTLPMKSTPALSATLS